MAAQCSEQTHFTSVGGEGGRGGGGGALPALVPSCLITVFEL
jgi:hypothetical protein